MWLLCGSSITPVKKYRSTMATGRPQTWFPISQQILPLFLIMDKRHHPYHRVLMLMCSHLKGTQKPLCSTSREIMGPDFLTVISREVEHSGFSVPFRSEHINMSTWWCERRCLSCIRKRSNICWDIANRVLGRPSYFSVSSFLVPFVE